jgi:hypothetical protein
LQKVSSSQKEKKFQKEKKLQQTILNLNIWIELWQFPKKNFHQKEVKVKLLVRSPQTGSNLDQDHLVWLFSQVIRWWSCGALQVQPRVGVAHL